MKEVKERILYIREKERVTTTQLAKDLSQKKKEYTITQQTISRYENGVRGIPLDFLQRFGDRFKVCGEWLLYGTCPIYRTKKNGTKDIRDVLGELINLLSTYEEKKGDFEKIPLEENYLLLLKAMTEDTEIGHKVMQFFHLFVKPQK